MYPYITLFGYNFSTFVICCGIGVIVSILLLSKLFRKKIIFNKYKNIILLSFLGMLFGAKIFSLVSYSLYYIHTYQRFSLIEILYNSGMVFYGGLIGYILTLKLLCKLKKYDFLEISSEIAISIPLFHTFGRLGCFFNGCCYGELYNGKLSMPYKIGVNGIWLQRFPTQITEMVFEFLLFISLYFIYKKQCKYLKERLLHIYLWLYSIFRFFIEFFRGDDIRGFLVGLSFSQVISCMIFIIITFTYIKNYNKKVV